MKLFEWTKQFIRFQDSMRRQIISIDETAEGYFVKEKNGEKKYLIEPKLSSKYFSENKEKIYVITANDKINVQYLIKHWKEVVNNAQITIIFVNPKTNEKWHVQPLHHQKISEKIDQGLLVLYEGCASYTE